MLGIGKFYGRPIEEVRDQVLGLKIVDFESDGRVIYLEDEDGRPYTIDTTGEKCVVHAGLTESEKVEYLEKVLDVVIETLGINEDELAEQLSSKFIFR